MAVANDTNAYRSREYSDECELRGDVRFPVTGTGLIRSCCSIGAGRGMEMEDHASGRIDSISYVNITARAVIAQKLHMLHTSAKGYGGYCGN